MNDKERLEEIKKHRNEADNSTDEYEFEKINFYNLHVDWLIEQAGRVQELERQVSRYKERLEVIVNYIITENKLDRYREDEDE